MMGPYYNSRSTMITMVVGGEGRLEMAGPHMSRREGSPGPEAGSAKYEAVRAELRVGTVAVVPVGHPFLAVASNNQNLQLLNFEVSADNNRKYVVAGRNNVMKRWEAEAKGVAFGVPAQEVEEILESQDLEFFYQGPQQVEEGGRAYV